MCDVAAGAEPAPSFDFKIDEDTLGDALTELSRQARIGFLYPYDLADSTDVNPLAGRMTVVEALGRLLHDTEFLADLTESGVIVVSRRNQESLDQMGMRNIDKALLAGVATLAIGAANAQGVETIDDNRDERGKKKLPQIFLTRKHPISCRQSPKLNRISGAQPRWIGLSAGTLVSAKQKSPCAP